VLASVNAVLRTAVQDRRRLVREVVATLLAAEPTVCSVMCVATLDELFGAISCGELDVVVLSAPDDPPEAWSRASVRLHRLSDSTPASFIVASVCGHLQPVEPAARESRNTPEVPGSLTQRETEILSRIADGMSTRQVATSLGISPRTVENHKQRIFAKLGVRSQAHAVAVTLASGDLPAMAADVSRCAR
jgi:DNA-binding CsgD family transcriptional regulator